MLLMSSSLYSQNRKPTEFEVKAAYLSNFGRFVKWPTAADRGVFSICVLGEDPFGPVLDSMISDEQVDGKRVSVRRVNSAGEASNCNIVFISTSEERRLASILAQLGKSPVLTVSEITGFTDHHGIIQFVMDHDRVRFEVNLAAADRVGLVLSSDLLKVATAVKREEHPGN
jgi:hypothetical protein